MKKMILFRCSGQIFVGKLFLVMKFKSLPLPSFLFSANILTAQIMIK